MPAEQDRMATLRRAAAAKRDAAVTRAEAGIRKLTKAGQPVTFRAVAAAGGVSVDFLYRHPGPRAPSNGFAATSPHPPDTRPASLATQPPPAWSPR
jgi:hypothetical protein